jgi:hypothetical protein
MLHQWDQRTCTDARQIGGIRTEGDWRVAKIRRCDPNRPAPSVRQRDNHVGGTASRPLLQHLKPMPKKEMMRVSDRDVRHDPLKNRGTPSCSVTPPTPTPSSTAWSITPIGSISTARACGEPANPAERPEQVTLWTCRCAWTTQGRCPHAHRNSRRRRPSSRDSRLTPRLARCQKIDSQNASRPGRHQIGMVGEIISESWARSYRYTRARSLESALNLGNVDFGLCRFWLYGLPQA